MAPRKPPKKKKGKKGQITKGDLQRLRGELTGGGGAAARAPLGYKKGETLPRTLASGWGGVGGFGRTRQFVTDPAKTRYKQGDEWQFAGRPAPEFTSIQQGLIDSGYADKLRIGVWDDASASAFQGLLADANRNGVDYNTMLGAAKEGAAAGGLGGGQQKMGQKIQRPDLFQGGGTFKTTAFQDVEADLRKSFSDALGRSPTNEESLRFVDSMKNSEVLSQALAQNQEDLNKRVEFLAQNAAINQEVAGQPALEAGQNVESGGKTYNVPNAIVAAPPSAAAQADWLARTKYPAEYAAFDSSKRYASIVDMMRQRAPGGTALGG